MFPSPFGHSFVVTTFFALNLFLSEDLCLKHTNIVFKLHWSLFVFCLTRFISNTMRGDHSFFYVYFNFCLWDLCHTWSISYSISFFYDLFCLTIVLYWFYYECQEKVFALSSQFGTGKPLCLTAQRFFFSVDISIYYTWVLAQSIERNTRESLDFYSLKQHKYETKISF